MNLSHFFIDRPIFATVLSIVIVVAGAIAYFTLPVAQYPEMVPPTVVVTANYPRATPEVIADTVATPIEQEVNGVENMLYMWSQSTSDGQMQLTITFKLGTDLNEAQVLVQNRVAVAEPRLPEEVRQIGVTTEKSSPDFLLVAHLLSPDNRYHQAYISNYALIRVRDVLARLDGVGDVTIFGAREYSMRIWLDPDKIAARNLTASDVVQALRQQNVQVAGGVIGQPPVPQSNAYQLSVNTLGRLTDVEQFGDIVVRTGEDRRITRLRDVARVEVGARDYASNSYLDGKPAQGIGIFQRPGSNALATAQAVRRTMADLSKQFPPGLEYRFVYDPTVFVQESMNAVFDTLLEASMLVFIVVLIFLQDWRATLLPMIDVPVALIGTLIVSMCLLSAIAGVWRRGMDNNILTQIGFVVLVALACKNAILIVEFAKEQQQAGKDRVAAAIEACRIRLRPILMTSFAFILGVVPLFVATGAGAEMLRALGTSVLSGMLGVTFFALLLTPVFYVVIRWFVERRREKPEPSLNHVGTLAIIALVPCLLLLSGRMLVGPDYKAPPLQAPAGFANKVGNQC